MSGFGFTSTDSSFKCISKVWAGADFDRAIFGISIRLLLPAIQLLVVLLASRTNEPA